MLFSYNWLKEYLQGKTPAAQKVADLLCFHSFEIEGLEKKGNDWLIDIDVLPNRAHDCFSHIGIAQEIAILTGNKFVIPKTTLKIKQGKVSDLLALKVESKDDCPRYTAQLISGVKVGESPKWLKERLSLLGLKPINNIVDITNYVMLETGQPLHAFDLDKIKGVQVQSSKFKVQSERKEIIIRRARNGETIKTFDEAKTEYKLDESILVIADIEKPIAIAGIKGGLETGIDKNTENVLIEAANFNPVLIRKASQKLKLRTDASNRFEHEITPNLIDFSQQRAFDLIVEIAGGVATGSLVDFYPNKVKERQIELNCEYVKRLLGLEITKINIEQILRKLDFSFKRKSNHQLLVIVPTSRLDLQIEEDLIEEIGRLYGYNNITPVFPEVVLKPSQENQEFIFENKIKNLFKELAFAEAYNYSFTPENIKAIFGFKEGELIFPANPMSTLNHYLRPCLAIHLIKNAKENLRYQNEVRIFEIGKVFLGKEKKSLGVVMAKQGLRNKEQGFFELKSYLEVLFNVLGLKVNYEPILEHNYLEAGCSAKIIVKQKEVGLIGLVKGKINQTKENIFIAELDFDFLQSQGQMKKGFKEIPQFPPVLLDLSFLADKSTLYSKIEQVIYLAKPAFLKEIELFEVYSGKGVEEGKENFGFHLTFQNPKATLSLEEVNKELIKIIQNLEKNGFIIRK
ncbi:phenylalanine--tRNA ligase subunit beta [bacterium (Candidatus Gribaldobacteria) CG23_combo_of_CG06-09_8_20_14_all_37_87_8]|uniref:Phenylalanine--tRNA ligase beta subunit n=2 Tax=Candidatus Gribaldobacteria TaxID=2798536 RepID=A0A2G9ZGM0_9BACT|nr:MAG: phenylalanine--tRNA ligase subunit beta [bacterium (Candidatus Gribaldobacteria) CG23_combo_of_CG06-09_8_20_14_all_37_87_8]PIR90465.1 MAG: phenylalanine--tRNA ligase subunit beta [bacterium (Candidatus Gribaldobacteria) CG10_big_fil_rev_8_21_14_0_10_37_21]